MRSGTFRSKFELIGPKDKSLGSGPLENVTIKRGLASTVVVKLMQLIVPEWGTFKARFSIGRERFEFPFEIVKVPRGTKPLANH
jgi:hypothetical protein